MCFRGVVSTAGVDAGPAFGLRVVNLLRPKSDLAGYKGMVGITVSAVIAPRVKDAAEVRSSGDDEVELVPVAGTGVSPRHFLQLLTLEEGVCDTQAMDATEF